MTTLTINDLPRNENLGRNAMAAVCGGWMKFGKLIPTDPVIPGDPVTPNDPIFPNDPIYVGSVRRYAR
jgi:hypothetical protein